MQLEEPVLVDHHSRPGKFRIRTKTLFLTYPQYEGTEEMQELAESVKSKFLHRKNQGNLQIPPKRYGAAIKVVCGLENHQDQQGKHVHMYVELDISDDFQGKSGLTFLDGLVEPRKHGHYQRARVANHVIKYCTKDGNFFSIGVDVARINDPVNKISRSQDYDTCILRIQEGETIDQLMDEYPLVIAKHLDSLTKWETKCKQRARDKQSKLKKKPYFGVHIPEFTGRIHRLQSAQVALWIHENFGTPMPEKPHKSSQLWLHGPTGKGKSWIASQLTDYFTPYVVKYEKNGWDEKWDEDKVDFAIFEEFTGQKSLSWMNTFLEGNPKIEFSLAVRNMPPIPKTKNVPCIILSNKSPAEVYHNASIEDRLVFNAFISRLKIVELTERIDIKFKDPIGVLEQSQELVIPLPIRSDDRASQIPTIHPRLVRDGQVHMGIARRNARLDWDDDDAEEESPTQRLSPQVLVGPTPSQEIRDRFERMIYIEDNCSPLSADFISNNLACRDESYDQYGTNINYGSFEDRLEEAGRTIAMLSGECERRKVDSPKEDEDSSSLDRLYKKTDISEDLSEMSDEDLPNLDEIDEVSPTPFKKVSAKKNKRKRN